MTMISSDTILEAARAKSVSAPEPAEPIEISVREAIAKGVPEQKSPRPVKTKDSGIEH
jgi:hypothetical protein